MCYVLHMHHDDNISFNQPPLIFYNSKHHFALIPIRANWHPLLV